MKIQMNIRMMMLIPAILVIPFLLASSATAQGLLPSDKQTELSGIRDIYSLIGGVNLRQANQQAAKLYYDYSKEKSSLDMVTTPAMLTAARKVTQSQVYHQGLPMPPERLHTGF